MKHKLANQLIKKHSLLHDRVAIRAMLEFSELAAKHERKAVRAIVKKTDKEISDLFGRIEDIEYDRSAEMYGNAIAMLSTPKKRKRA